MRVLVWNMNNGGPGSSTAKHDRGWDYLRERQATFDVALLQETRDPRSHAAGAWRSIVWRPKYEAASSGHALWGCAVVASSMELEEYEPDESFPWLKQLRGSTAIARASTNPRWIASVHLSHKRIPSDVLERHSIQDVPLSTPDKSVWETNVIPHELTRLFGTETFLWGGDLNTDPGMDDIRGFTGGNRRMFGNYRQSGSRDTRTRFFDSPQRTYFKDGNRHYQLDHVFADEVTERRVVDWRVNEQAATGTDPHSDHAPILITLDDSAGG